MSLLTTASRPATALVLKHLITRHQLAANFVVTYAGGCLSRSIISSVCISLLVLSFSMQPVAATSSVAASDLAE